jgi:copper chaperone CopZ
MQMTKNAVLKVTGMSCAHCVDHVTKALKNVPGVITARVDLVKGQAEVSYDDAKADLADLEKAVVKAGYSVSR